MRSFIVFVLSLLFLQGFAANVEQIPRWEEGMLDIHTISTGRGNCQYIVMPDGTTMMIDAGDLDGKKFDKKRKPMRCARLKDNTISAAQVISDYIEKIPGDFPHEIDYFLLTHFHADHFGAVRKGLLTKNGSDYQLVGVSELAEYIPIHALVDRGYPSYDFPFALRGRVNEEGKVMDVSFENYLRFADYNERHNGMARERFRFGKDQFVLKHKPEQYPAFKVSNIKTDNLLFDEATGKTTQLFAVEEFIDKKGEFKENPLSCAIVMQYGDFRYYAGGDNTGLTDFDYPRYRDVETPMSKVVGKVTAMTLNHHGNRDTTNETFLATLDPEVVILQAWCTAQPAQDVAHRLFSKNIGTKKRKVYMTNYDPLSAAVIGNWFPEKLKGKDCHIVIRVLPDGSYKVYAIDNGNHL